MFYFAVPSIWPDRIIDLFHLSLSLHFFLNSSISVAECQRYKVHYIAFMKKNPCLQDWIQTSATSFQKLVKIKKNPENHARKSQPQNDDSSRNHKLPIRPYWISTDSSLLNIRHSHQFVAVVI